MNIQLWFWSQEELRERLEVRTVDEVILTRSHRTKHIVHGWSCCVMQDHCWTREDIMEQLKIGRDVNNGIKQKRRATKF